MSRRHLGRMRKLQGTPPDLTKYVLCCPVCRWSVQAGPRARSDIGGMELLMQAIAQAASDHHNAEHPDDEVTAEMSTGQDANVLFPVPLPRWWVEKN